MPPTDPGRHARITEHDSCSFRRGSVTRGPCRTCPRHARFPSAGRGLEVHSPHTRVASRHLRAALSATRGGLPREAPSLIEARPRLHPATLPGRVVALRNPYFSPATSPFPRTAESRVRQSRALAARARSHAFDPRLRATARRQPHSERRRSAGHSESWNKAESGETSHRTVFDRVESPQWATIGAARRPC